MRLLVAFDKSRQLYFILFTALSYIQSVLQLLNKIIRHESRTTDNRIKNITLTGNLRRYHFSICDQLISTTNQISRAVQEYMLKISTVQLKALLIVACKFVNNTWIFFMVDRFLSDAQIVKIPLLYDHHKCKLESLTPIWKCFGIQLPSVSWMNNLKRHSLVICLKIKDLLDRQMHDFAKYTKMSTIYQQ